MLNRRKVDKEIVDQGWNEMSLLLDAEMPVVWKKRRRLIFWFWGVFFLGIIGAFTWYNFSANEGADHEILTPQQQQSENIPIVHSDPETAASETAAPETITHGNEIADDSGNIKNSEILIIERSNENDKNETIVLKPTNLKDASRSNMIKDPINATEEVIESGMDLVNDENNFKSSDFINETPIRNEDNRLIEVISNRIALNINPLALSEGALTWERTFQNDLIITPLYESSRSQWLVYLNTRLIQYEHSNLELGLGYDVKLSSRFSIIPQLGFGWDQVDYGQSESQGRAVEFSSANGLDSDQFISNLNQGIKGNYLGLSVDASYRVFGKWHFNAGLNYRVPSESFNSGSDELAVEDNSADPNAEISASSTIISNNDLFLRIGISNRINRRYSIGLYYYSQLNDPYDVLINGLKDTQANSTFFPRRTSLNIFMDYRF